MSNPAYSYTGQESYSLISQSAFYREELSEEVVMPYGDEGLDRFFDVFGMIMGSIMGQGLMLGQAKAVTTPDFWHVERQRMMSKITVDANTTAAATKTLTLEGVDANTPGSHSSDGTKSPVREGDVYILASTGKQVLATSVSTATPYAHTVTVQKLDGTAFTSPADDVSAGDGLIYITNIFDEGSGPNDSLITEDVLVTGQLQIIKDAFKTTLTANSTMDEVRWPGGLGVPAGNYRVLTDERDAIARQFRNIDLALLLQEESAISGKRSTKGLLPIIKDSGYTQGYTVGSFNIDDFITVNKKLNAQRSPKEYKWIVGYDLMSELEEVFHEYFNLQTNAAGSAAQGGSGISYASYGGAKNIALSMGVRSFCRGGFTHHFHTYSEWSDEETFGAASGGLKTTLGRLSEEAILLPMQKVKDYGSGEGPYSNVGPNPNSMVYPMMVRFLSGNGENRLMETTEFGTRGGTAKGTRDDIFGYDYRSEVGLQIRSAKDFGYLFAE